MPSQTKIQQVSDLTQKVQKSSLVAFFEYKNLGANALNDLRIKIGEVGAEVLVAKNTLVKIALGDKQAKDADLQGQTGLVFTHTDSISPLKILYDFSKKFESVRIKGAFVDGVYYESVKVVEMGQLPSRLDLIARALSGFISPISKFVYALSAVADKKEVQE